MKNKRLNQNSYNLGFLIWADLIGQVKKLFIKDAMVDFPKTINDYTFDSEQKKIGPRKDYRLGIYKNSAGKKALFKVRNARIKDYHYYSLRNEITLYQILNNVTQKLGNSMPTKFKNVSLSKVVGVVEKDRYLGVLLEYIEGKNAQNLSPHQKVKVYFKIVEFLCFIGKNLTDDEKRQISKRQYLHYLFLYPFLIIKAIITYPRSTKYVLLGIPVFLAGFIQMKKKNRLALTHRDMHFKNIMISNNELILIDLQQCVLTEPLYELVTTLRYSWKRDKFHMVLLKKIFEKHSLDENFMPLFKGLIVNSATHGLTGKGFAKEEIYRWNDFLKYGIYMSV